MRGFDGTETSIARLKDKWLNTLFFWKEEGFYSYLFDIIDFVDIFFLGCKFVISFLWDVFSTFSLVSISFL